MTPLQQEIWERFLELVSENIAKEVTAFKMHQNGHQALRKGVHFDVLC